MLSFNFIIYKLFFFFFTEKIQKKYKDENDEIQLIDLQKGSNGLGISLAGHRDRTQMSVYVCGLNPNGNAFKDGRIHVGDEILEVCFEIAFHIDQYLVQGA